MNWKYRNEEFVNATEDTYGFIYCIYYTDGSRYIGKKNFWKDVRLKPRKTDRVNAKRIVTRETDWKRYLGSSKITMHLEVESKVILRLCRTKTDLTYWENYYLYQEEVLFDDMYHNQNIGGKVFPSEHLTGSKEYRK